MNKSKMARRMCTAALASALTIALSSCTGATNTYCKIDEKKDTVYASSNGCNVTYGELWDELQWSSESVLENQITNVVLQKYFNNIYTLRANVVTGLFNTFSIALIVCRDTLHMSASCSCEKSFAALAAFIFRFFIPHPPPVSSQAS